MYFLRLGEEDEHLPAQLDGGERSRGRFGARVVLSKTARAQGREAAAGAARAGVKGEDSYSWLGSWHSYQVSAYLS